MYRALGAVMLKVRECSGGVFVSRRLARPGQSMVGWTSKLRVGRLFDILFIKKWWIMKMYGRCLRTVKSLHYSNLRYRLHSCASLFYKITKATRRYSEVR